ncbi:response regulator [Paenibacillus sp. N3.4]|uniref:response regulator n=1 Tax=Paenibacillus sp. N3.4 TaxID=2603222 RepID=UPI00165010D1|nr:response regulator [Paenibacillus sp. N3.4]
MYKLLILDDEPIILDGLKHILNWNELGFDIVATASDGLEGLEKIQEQTPDFVITDIRMKFMDGLTFIKEAKSVHPGIMFVVLSAFSDFEYAKESIQLGVYNYILKPVDRSTENHRDGNFFSKSIIKGY